MRLFMSSTGNGPKLGRFPYFVVDRDSLFRKGSGVVLDVNKSRSFLFELALMDTPDYFGTTDSPPPPLSSSRPNSDDLSMVIDRLRLSSFVAYALGYTFAALAKEYSSHLSGFSDVCDHIGDLMLTSAQILEQ